MPKHILLPLNHYIVNDTVSSIEDKTTGHFGWLSDLVRPRVLSDQL